MAGLVFLADFFGWTAHEAVEAYIFRSDVQYALNLEPGVEVSARTVERYQKLFRDDDLAARVFDDVTTRLVQALDLDVSRQRLDSTHVFSHMASFGRTKLMAVAIKRFLTQVKRHDPDAYAALPEDLRRRYEPRQARLFADAKDAEARARCRQQAAEDLRFIIDRFADRPDLANRSTYKALVTIFDQQCEVSGDKVVVKAKTGGDCVQNPSDLDATYDGHKGPGYQVQIAETCVPSNEVQLITAALPQTACEPDAAAVVPMLDQLANGRATSPRNSWPTRSTPATRTSRPPRLGAWTWSVRSPAARRRPTPGADGRRLRVDERTGRSTPAPRATGRRRVRATRRRRRRGSRCRHRPARRARSGSNVRSSKHVMAKFTLEFTDKDRRLAGRRVEEATECSRSGTRRGRGSSRPTAG